jgi:hypothetical protein
LISTDFYDTQEILERIYLRKQWDPLDQHHSKWQLLVLRGHWTLEMLLVAQCGGACLQSQYLGGWGRRITSLRQAWLTQWALSQKQTNKQANTLNVASVIQDVLWM